MGLLRARLWCRDVSLPSLPHASRSVQGHERKYSARLRHASGRWSLITAACLTQHGRSCGESTVVGFQTHLASCADRLDRRHVSQYNLLCWNKIPWSRTQMASSAGRLEPNAVVAVDVGLFTVRAAADIQDAWQVLLVQRDDAAFAGKWSLP